MEPTNTPIETGKKKSSLTVIAIIVIILAIIAIVAFKNKGTPTVSEPDIPLNQAMESDTTKSINDRLDNINLDDTTDIDLNSVDTDIQTL